MQAARQFAQGNEPPVQVANLVFVWLAHIQDEEVVTPVEARLELPRRDLRYAQVRSRGFFSAHTAKLIVVNELVNGAVCATHRAIRVFPELQLAELHP